MLIEKVLDLNKNAIWNTFAPAAITKQFPLCLLESGFFSCKNNFVTERANQNDYEVIFTTKGSGEIIYQNEVYMLDANSVFILDCNYHSKYYTTGDVWDYYWLHFLGTSATFQYEHIVACDNLIRLDCDTNNEVMMLFQKIVQKPETATLANAFTQCTYIQYLLNGLYVSSKRNQCTSKSIPCLKSAVEFMDKNYDTPLSVDTICNHIHLSKSYFIVLFKQHMGVTPYDYILTLRIIRSKELLVTTGLSVGQIGVNVGFKDSTYFIRMFKKRLGITPSGYRNNFYKNKGITVDSDN